MFARLYLICFALSCLLCIAVAKESNDDWTEVYNAVYATNGDPIEPAKTRELLRRLAKIYEHEEDADLMRKNIAALIEASDLDERKCTTDGIISLNELIESSKIYTLNLVPYLKDCRRKFYSFCEETFEDELQESVSPLSSTEKLKINLLRQSVADSLDESLDIDKDYASIPRESMEAGLLSFIEQQTKTTVDEADKADGQDAKISKPEFLREFEGRIVNLCERVTWAVDHKLELLMDDQELVNIMDSDILNWMTNWRLCRDIRQDMINIASETYELIGKSKSLAKQGRKRDVIRRALKARLHHSR